jgi:pimeloyl-ACP methyl ester carboxylesterase
MYREIEAGVLRIVYLDHGDPQTMPVVLLHGFPYDIHAYDDVTPQLVASGYRVLVPFLRGFGPTRFLSAQTLRSGQQAALGSDLLAFMDALSLPRAVLAGYDWGGRAACVVAALWPERVIGLVSATGYNIQDIAAAVEPLSAQMEHRL